MTTRGSCAMRSPICSTTVHPQLSWNPAPRRRPPRALTPLAWPPRLRVPSARKFVEASRPRPTTPPAAALASTSTCICLVNPNSADSLDPRRHQEIGYLEPELSGQGTRAGGRAGRAAGWSRWRPCAATGRGLAASRRCTRSTADGRWHSLPAGSIRISDASDTTASCDRCSPSTPSTTIPTCRRPSSNRLAVPPLRACPPSPRSPPVTTSARTEPRVAPAEPGAREERRCEERGSAMPYGSTSPSPVMVAGLVPVVDQVVVHHVVAGGQ